MVALRVSRGSGKAVFDSDNKQITFFDSAGVPEAVQLSFSESGTLQLLIKRAGEVVSRDDIMKFAWSSRVVASGSINQCIFSLRNIIGDDKGLEIIQTVTRKGYKFNQEALMLPGNDSEGFPSGRSGDTSFSKSNDQASNQVNDPIADPCDVSAPDSGRLKPVRNGDVSLSKGLARPILFFIVVLLLLVATVDLDSARHLPKVLATDPPVVNEYQSNGYHFFLFDVAPDDPLVTGLVSRLGVPKEKPVLLTLRRWGGGLSVSCISARRYAVNIRIEAGMNVANTFRGMIDLCERK